MKKHLFFICNQFLLSANALIHVINHLFSKNKKKFNNSKMLRICLNRGRISLPRVHRRFMNEAAALRCFYSLFATLKRREEF